jgi:peptide/nickel transport system substrate-binding protein
MEGVMVRRTCLQRPLAIALVAIGLPACQVALAGPGGRRNPDDTVVVRSAQEPDTLDPTLSNAIAGVDASTPLFSGLVGVDEQLEPFPDLLAVLPRSSNGGVAREGAGMRITYRLRPGVVFHDGHPLTSRDVVFTWKFHMDPRVPVTSREGYELITRIDTPDALTAVVHLSRVYAPYLSLFSLPGDPILPAHLLEGSSDPVHDPFHRAPVGSGPYRFVKWQPGEYLELESFPGYHRGAPRLRRWIMKFVPDDHAAYLQLVNGEVDILADLSIDQVALARQEPLVRVVNVPGLTFEQLAFNLDRPLLADRRVREAIARSIDKASLSRAILQGVWPPAPCPQHPLSWGYPPGYRDPYPFSPDRARQLLDEAGWKVGPEGLRLREGKPLQLTLVSTAGRRFRESLEQVLSEVFRKQGIALEIRNVEGGLLFGGWPQGLLQSGQFDLALYANTSSLDPASQRGSYHSTLVPPAGQNTYRLRDRLLDRLLDLGERTLEQARRQPLYWQANTRLMQDLPTVPLFYWTELHAIHRNLTGFRAHPANQRFVWNVHDWAWNAPSATPSATGLPVRQEAP